MPEHNRPYGKTGGSLHLKVKLPPVTALVWSIALGLYGCETWTINAEENRRIQGFVMETAESELDRESHQ